MSAPCALLLTNDPLEAYAAKLGAVPRQAALSPNGVFGSVVVAYQATRGGRWAPRPGLIVYRVRAFRVERPGVLRGLAFAASFAWFILSVSLIARAHRVDLIRAYNPFVPGVAAVVTGRLVRRPCIVAVHTDPTAVLERLDPAARRVFGLLERFALSRADRVWCVTEYVREAVVARGASPQKVRIVPNRVPVAELAAPNATREADTRARYGIPHEARLVVGVGRLEPEKDPLTVVRAFARVARPDARLVLVGDGPLREALQKVAALAGLDGRVVITGFRPREEVTSFLHLATCYVMASRYEGFPLALAEALAAGVPIVASDAPQLDELLSGVSAMRFPAGNTKALAACMERVLADPAASRAAAAAGRGQVARFDLDLIDRVEAEFYRELLQEGPTRRAVR